MKVLVLGSGAREHALWWKARQSPMADEVLWGPGNGAARAAGVAVAVDPKDPADVVRLVRERAVDLTVIGPDDAVAAGVADALAEEGRLVFGPAAAAGRIESSKSFAKELMRDAGVPTPTYEVFDDVVAARDYARANASNGIVVKADGLALGKGVVVCDGVDDAIVAIDGAMVEHSFGAAGNRVILEERISGPEASVMFFCDGVRAVPMAPARDYKRAFDGDRGLNTGGMGAYSPPSDVTAGLIEEVRGRCAEPVLDALAERGTPYQGCLYTQVMLTAEGPKVIEFNARFGDPEAQVVLPRVQYDLIEVMVACAEGGLSDSVFPDPRVGLGTSTATVGVVMASRGYPGKPETGYPIRGLERVGEDALIFHAGTRLHDDTFVTSGGRVLTVVASGPDVATARVRAYENVARISFEGSFYRRDIAAAET